LSGDRFCSLSLMHGTGFDRPVKSGLVYLAGYISSQQPEKTVYL